MRLIHAVRDLNAEGGGADPHDRAPHRRGAYGDVRPRGRRGLRARARPRHGPTSTSPSSSGRWSRRAADAVWVGWGFVAEDPAFADLCERLGVTFIGPSAEAMRKLGDKIGSKLIAEEVGVPVAPWSRGGVDTLEDALGRGRAHRLPADAQGHRRRRRPRHPHGRLRGRARGRLPAHPRRGRARLRQRRRLPRAPGHRRPARRGPADRRRPRHRVGASASATAPCSGATRRSSRSPPRRCSTPSQTDELKASAERLALAVGYVGAGTVEFLYHPGEKTFAFLEVNTRLQVEHPITEVTTDLDLVKAQIHVAAGGRLEGEKPAETGHAVEARLNAEDPDRDFAPVAGPDRAARAARRPRHPRRHRRRRGRHHPGRLRLDDRQDHRLRPHPRRGAGPAAPGDGRDHRGHRGRRHQQELRPRPARPARGRRRRRPGWADTGWIDRVRAEGRLVAHEHSGIALVAAGIEAYEDEDAGRDHPAARDRPRRPPAGPAQGRPGGRPQAARHGVQGHGAPDRPAPLPGQRRRRRRRAASSTAELERLDEFHARLTVGDQRYRLVTATHGPGPPGRGRRRRPPGHPRRGRRAALARRPRWSSATPVAVGDVVAAGAPVLVLESMKMETVLRAPFDGRVAELLVMTGSQVETGAPLVRLEPVGDDAAEAGRRRRAAGPGLDLPPSRPTPPAQRRAPRAAAPTSPRMLLGFDVDPQRGRRRCSPTTSPPATSCGAAGVDVVADEIELLGLFADLAELSRNRPAGEELHTELRVHSSQEHFHTYLQSLDVDRGGLPEQFRDRLARVLAPLRRRPTSTAPRQLEEAVFRIFLAQQRSAPDVRARDRAAAALDRRAAAGATSWPARPASSSSGSSGPPSCASRWSATWPAASASAGSTSRWSTRSASSVLAGVRDEVAALAADPDAPDRAERHRGAGRHPRADRAASSPSGSSTASRSTSRCSRCWSAATTASTTCTTCGPRSVGGRPFAVADYVLDDRPTRLVSTVGTVAELGDPDGALAAPLGDAARRARAPATRRSSTSTCTGPTPRSRPSEASAELRARASARCRSPRRTPDRGGGLRRRRPAGRLLHLSGPSPTAAIGRGRPGPRRAPDGRSPAEPVAAARLRRHPHRGARGRAALRVRRPGEPRRPPAGRAGPGAPARRRARRRRHASSACPTPSGPWRTASRRSAAPAASRGAAGSKLDINHVWVQVWPVVEADLDQLTALQGKITPAHRRRRHRGGPGPGPGRRPRRHAGARSRSGSTPGPGAGVTASVEEPPTEPLQAARRLRRQGRCGPVVAAWSTPTSSRACWPGPDGSLVEHDLDDTGALVPVDRPRGLNKAGILVAVVTTPTAAAPRGRHPRRALRRPDQGARRGRPSRSARGSSPRSTWPSGCRCPVEWFALSAGARISMDSGTENMDWVAAGAASGSSSSPRPAARSTSSWPASTSARSPTGTPRRRCSCTPRASW